MIRLMTDEGYSDAYTEGRQELPERGPNRRDPHRTIWIYRYYDVTSLVDRGREGIRLEIEDAACDLAKYIEHIREVTGAGKVILVGHSTGGLIIRCLLQKVYPEESVDGVDRVDKVFTYATPHGGIHFDIAGGNALEWLRDAWARNNMDDFGPRRLRQFLTPDRNHPACNPEGGPGARRYEDARPAELPEAAPFDPQELRSFPPERFFCLVGTNAHDYEVAMGLSRTIVGPQSDGLVQIRKAYVHDAPRAYVHRAHSGRYGIVNSEEGYQNLRRFLFGNVKIDLALDDLDNISSSSESNDVSHQADVTVSIRGLRSLMHDQKVAHHSPVLLEWEKGEEGEPIPLFAVFLIPSLADPGEPSQYALELAISRFVRHEGKLWFKDHLEQVPLWSDALIADVEENPEHAPDGLPYVAHYSWRSEAEDIHRLTTTRRLDWEHTARGLVGRVPLPDHARKLLGDRASIVMTATGWE